jgi:hypothetical protein
MLEVLSGLITFKTRADGKGWRDAFENMPIYLEVGRMFALPMCTGAGRAVIGRQRLKKTRAHAALPFFDAQRCPFTHKHARTHTHSQRLGIADDLQRLSVVHVAGTKGKGSTCAMVESMLRASGHRTGLFTSPHLVDVRERVRIDGRMLPRDEFAAHFWRVHDALTAAATPEVGVPGYFRFLTLLGAFVGLCVCVCVLC